MGLFTRTASPLDQEVQDLGAEFRNLLSAENERLTRMQTYRDELEAVRSTSLNASVGADYGRVANDPSPHRHRFNLPFGQAMTVKHSFRVAGRLPDALVDRREETEEERHRSDTMEKIWWGITRESGGEAQLADASWDASQLGAACFETYLDLRRQMPVYRAIDPAGTLVVRGVLDPHDFQRVYRFWDAPLASVVAQYREGSVDGAPIALNEIQADPTGSVRIVQMTDKTRVVRWALGRADGRGDTVQDVPLYRRTHNYGFVNYVVIPNLGPERNVWGWADYEFTREVIDYIGKLFGREADILKMVANGAMTLSGSKLSPGAVAQILHKGGILPLSKEGKLEPVAVPEVPNFEQAHAERSIKFLQMLGFAPEAAWGDGAAGSGSDRGLQLGPMLELTSMKQINFGSGLSRLASMMYRMVEGQTVEPARYTGVAARGAKRTPFNFSFGPGAASLETSDGGELPMTPKELFDGDYKIRFSWPTRLDPDDPAYVASELNKFTSGVQSARTTLEKFGVESPEDELKLIEQENDDHPWLRQGMLKLIEMQLGASQQGQNDGSQNTAADPYGAATATMTSKDGKALDGDAMSGALPSSFGVLSGQA